MKNKKKAYITLETVIILSIVLVFGLLATTRVMNNNKTAVKEGHGIVKNTITNVTNFRPAPPYAGK